MDVAMVKAVLKPFLLYTEQSELDHSVLCDLLKSALSP